MSLNSFSDLYEQADRLASPVAVAAAGGADATVIQALELARRRGWVRPILTGDLDRINQIATSLEIDLDCFELMADQADSATVAVEQVKSGRAQLLLKGQIPTPSLMKAILDRESGLRTGRCICQIVLMEIERDDRRFLMTDTGVTIRPTLEQKRDLIHLIGETAKSLGSQTPRIALMSCTEKPNAAVPDSIESQELANSEDFPEYVVQGPLSFDLAYAKDAATKKGFGGDVTGAADAMVFPDLSSANLTVKGIMYTAGCRFGGVLRGTSSPVVFMSRADTVETRMNSLAYAIGLIETDHSQSAG